MIAIRSGLPALVAATFGVLATVAGAHAAPALEPVGPKGAEATASIRTVAAVTEADDDSANCSRSRKRLWVEGEGWLVRRVTTCR